MILKNLDPSINIHIFYSLTFCEELLAKYTKRLQITNLFLGNFCRNIPILVNEKNQETSDFLIKFVWDDLQISEYWAVAYTGEGVNGVISPPLSISPKWSQTARGGLGGGGQRGHCPPRLLPPPK